MGGINVKNTMVERVLQILAPHPCFGCGKLGAVLCVDCKYDIEFEGFSGCVLCGLPSAVGVCEDHQSPFMQSFVVGVRYGALSDTINTYKFARSKDSAHHLSELLDRRIPTLPSDIIVTSVPTVRSHIRERGYDHAALLARHLSSRRGLQYISLLERHSSKTQHVVDKKERFTQASEAYRLSASFQDINPRNVLLVDDIITTGATIVAAAKQLNAAGMNVFVAALAYQPLD